VKSPSNSGSGSPTRGVNPLWKAWLIRDWTTVARAGAAEGTPPTGSGRFGVGPGVSVGSSVWSWVWAWIPSWRTGSVCGGSSPPSCGDRAGPAGAARVGVGPGCVFGGPRTALVGDFPYPNWGSFPEGFTVTVTVIVRPCRYRVQGTNGPPGFAWRAWSCSVIAAWTRWPGMVIRTRHPAGAVTSIFHVVAW
jgi:hypothetical protein